MHYIHQHNRAFEAATVTLRYFTALCLPMGKTREIFDFRFLAKPRFFQTNYYDVTKVEMPNCVLTGNMTNEFVAVRVYQAVKIQRLQMRSLLTSTSCRNKQCARIWVCCLHNSLIFIGFAKLSHASSSVYTIITNFLSTIQINKPRATVLNMNIHDPSRYSVSIFCKWRLTSMSGFPTSCPQNQKQMTKLLIQI